jgi:hypothetical protein
MSETKSGTTRFHPYEARALWMFRFGPVNFGVIEMSRFAGGRAILANDKRLLVIERAADYWGFGLVRQQERSAAWARRQEEEGKTSHDV